jgi:hypothetical protein
LGWHFACFGEKRQFSPKDAASEGALMLVIRTAGMASKTTFITSP